MWISSNILSQMVDISDINPEDLALKITMASAEIESVEYVNGHLNTTVTAKILDKKPHPDSDHLTLVELDAGDGQITKVVCGAPNHKTGDIVALAKVGTVFSKDFVIKKSKIRGQESNGMLCSEKELGFSDDHSGIMILPPDTKPGIPLSRLFPDWYDVRFEIDNKSITHRPDLWGHTGFAREVAAVLGRPFRDPVKYDLEKELNGTDELNINVKTEACLRYSALKIRGIKTAESPQWLKARLSAIGMRPISNIVDITNYVMAEIGEPLHAFDTAKLHGNTITVRMAEKGEPVTTLDGVKHELMEEDIVIADASGPVALAGVMGGENSDIEDSTSEIILEAATFNPVNVRKTAARYNNRTEAAMRFEKTLTPEITKAALLRCWELIKECCPDAAAATGIVDVYPKKQEAVTISISTDTIRQQLGEDLSDEKIISILTSLDFKVKADGHALTIGVPMYRSTKDVTIPADIVEEVGRVFGYDNIQSRPPLVPCLPPARNEMRYFERSVKEILSRDEGMTEVNGYSFVGEAALKLLGIFDDSELRLKNPLSKEADRLSKTLIPNILKDIQLNQKNFDEFSIYEMNRVHMKADRMSKDLIGEERMLTGAVFAKKTDSPIFYAGKNIVASLLGKLHLKKVHLKPASENLPPYAHPGRSVTVEADGTQLGMIFELHPKTAADFEIRGSAVLFDLSITKLFEAKKEEVMFKELQRFPEVPFEISVVADEFVHASDISEIIAKSSRKLISSVEVISVYQGEQLEKGKKSVSFRVIFAAEDHTLTAEEIESVQKKIISDLAGKGFTLR